MTIETLLQQATSARTLQRSLDTATKNAFLSDLAEALWQHRGAIYQANQTDCAQPGVDALPLTTQKRLLLTEDKWLPVIDGLRQLAQLPDPVGKVLRHTRLDDGLELQQKTVPLGTLAIIFEARPDVLPQVAGLALKSGNVVLLKGGQESLHTNRAIMHVLLQVTAEYGGSVSPFWAQLVEGREIVHQLLQHPEAIDLVIPRGSNQMVQSIMANTHIPVLGHADGICHLYWHASADTQKALDTVIDAKIQYPAACNALETLLVDATVAQTVLPQLLARGKAEGVTVLGCPQTARLWNVLQVDNWSTEYGDLTLAVKVVNNLDEAVEHINTYGSHHTDGILCQDPLAAAQFLNRVDSASVYVNASTRFADGYRYGLGAEVGISTSRTHARGPVGLEGLVSTQWVLKGQYHQVRDYVGQQARPFLHQTLIPTDS